MEIARGGTASVAVSIDMCVAVAVGVDIFVALAVGFIGFGATIHTLLEI